MRKAILKIIILIALLGFCQFSWAAEQTSRVPAESETSTKAPAEKDSTESSSSAAAKETAAEATTMATTTTTTGGQPFKSTENFQVEPTTGTASLTISIEVPPGRKGIQPNIVLMYNSGSPNGILDVGWNLDLGSIQRSTKKGVPTYNDALDNFVLAQQGSIQELVSIGGNQYRPKIEGAFMKIQYISFSAGWVVTDKKGIKYYFGQTAASQQNDGTKIFKWCLDRVEDLTGNYMTIAYLKDQNQIYPEHIYYTGNSAQANPTFSDIEFILEDRTDTNISYRAGFAITTAKRLKEIKVKAAGNLQRRYQLNYNYSSSGARSLLTSITQYGADGTSSLPPTSFNYQTINKSWQLTSGWQIPWDSRFGHWRFNRGFVVDEGARLADFNADGFVDILKYGNENEWRNMVFIHNSSNGLSKTTTWRMPDWMAFVGDRDCYISDHGIRLADVDNDGFVDILQHVKGTSCTLNRIFLNNRTNGWTLSSLTMPEGIFFIDDHSMGGACTGWTENRGVVPQDINGDGFIDIVRAQGSERISYIFNGTGWTRNSAWDMPDGDLSNGSTELVDINGDGLSDILIAEDGGSRRAYQNNGSGWLRSPGYDMPEGKFSDGSTQIADIDGDGLPDILIASDSVHKIYINNGKGWTFDGLWQIPNDIDFRGGRSRVLDANGDGLMDLMYHYAPHSSPPEDTVTHLYLNQGVANNFPDLLKTIDNGIGAVTSVAYTPSNRYDNTGGDGISDLPFPVETVSSVTITEQVSAQSYVTNYEYKNGKFDFASREFRGFGYVKVTDAEGNYTETEFLQDDFKKGRVKESRAYNSAGNLYSKVVNDWQEQDLGNGSHFVYLSKADNFIYDGESTGKRTQAQYFYEESPQYGNLTKTVELGEVALDTGADIGTDKRTSIIEYVNNSSLWLLGIPKRASVQNNDATTIKKSEFYYDGNTNLDDLPITGNLTKQVDWLDGGSSPVTQFGYDDYGNLLSIINPLGYSTTTTYDSTYHIFPLTATNALGHQAVTQYYGVNGVPLDDGTGYHGLWGQVKSVKDPNNKSASTTYDTFGRVVATISEYDSINYPTSSVEYDLSSVPIKITTHQREVSGQAGTLDSLQFYDGLGRLIETKTESEDPAQQIISGLTEYNSRGLPIKNYLPAFTPATPNFTTPNYSGPFTKIDYDCMGRVVKTTNPDGSYANVIYDDWKVETIDENGHRLASYSDAYGRLIKKEEYTGADSRSSHYTTTPYTLYATTLYTYDSLGSLTQTKDNSNHITTIAYDTLGRKKSMADPDMGNWQYFYDGVGNLVKQIDNKNQTTQFQYDNLNRLTIKSYPLSGQTNVSYTYDDIAVANSKGRLTQATYQSSANTRFAYDSLGRETQSVKKIDGIDYTVSRNYDAASRLTSINYPDASPVSYIYNSAGQIESVYSGINNFVTSVDYSASGQITKIVYGNGVVTDYAYDPNTLRLTHLVTKDSKNVKLQDLSYSFDEVGNVLAITDNLNSASQTFAYDALNRLIGASGTYYGNKTYAYDAIGNITSKDGFTFNYGEGAAGPHALTSASDGSTFTYDLNGNMKSLTKNGTTTNYSYDWENRLTKVIKANKDLASFNYDGDGGRTKKIAYSYQTNTRYDCSKTLPFPTPTPRAYRFSPKSQLRYVFEFRSSFLEANYTQIGTDEKLQMGTDNTDKNIRLIQLVANNLCDNRAAFSSAIICGLKDFFTTKEAEAATDNMQLAMPFGCIPYTTTVAISTPTVYVGNLFEKTNDVVTKHIFLGSQRIASVTGSNVNYYHPDHLGSSNVISDQNGIAVQHLEYDPYGTIALAEGQNKTDYKFTGKELDEETGLYYYGARYYNPLIGRFITPDPIVPSSNDSQAFNRYSYARDNPVVMIDPNGRWFWVAVIVGAILGGGSAAINNQPIWQGMLMGAAGGFFVGGGAAAFGFWGTVGGGMLAGGANSAVFGGNIGIGILAGGLGAGLGYSLGSWAGGWNEFSSWGELGVAAIAGSMAGGLSAELSGGKFGRGAWMGAAYGTAGFAGAKTVSSLDPRIRQAKRYEQEVKARHALNTKKNDMVKIDVGARPVVGSAGHRFLEGFQMGRDRLSGYIRTTNTIEDLSKWPTYQATQKAITAGTAQYSTTEVSASGLVDAMSLYEQHWVNTNTSYNAGSYNSNYAVNTVIYSAGGSVPGGLGWTPSFGTAPASVFYPYISREN